MPGLPCSISHQSSFRFPFHLVLLADYHPHQRMERIFQVRFTHQPSTVCLDPSSSLDELVDQLRIPDSFTACLSVYVFQWWILISIVTPAGTRTQCLFDCACANARIDVFRMLTVTQPIAYKTSSERPQADTFNF